MNLPRSIDRSIRLLTATLLLALFGSHLQAQTPQTSSTTATVSGAPVYVTPTVTPEMGDRGGLFFGKTPDPAKTRHYYIAAEPYLWNFVPEGRDTICGKPLPAALQLEHAAWKIRYVQYADANFSALVLPTERLGIMGPVLRGVTGEYIAVTFLNRSWKPVSMHPHGVRYDKDSEGSYYQPAPGLGAAVAPFAKFTYVWHLDEESAPLPTEASSKAWLYHSHVAGDDDVNMGLIGAIIVTDPKRARADGTPKDVDREMAALFMIFNESTFTNTDSGDDDDKPPVPPSASGSTAAAAPIQPPDWASQQQMLEIGQRHTINGRVFGNLGGLEMNEGERVRWYLFGLGSEHDFHTAHWHGMTVTEDAQRRTDSVELLPASMKVADMKANNPGQWLLHCHVAEHMNEGMFARFTVHPSSEPEKAASREPDVAFFGMPQSLSTLRFQTAELKLNAKKPEASEIDFTGKVTVPVPFPLALNAVTIRIGKKSLTLNPDSSGICNAPEATLFVTNVTSYGVVTQGLMNFELTLKGKAWVDQLNELHVVSKNALSPKAALPISLMVGSAQHVAAPVLKAAKD